MPPGSTPPAQLPLVRLPQHYIGVCSGESERRGTGPGAARILADDSISDPPSGEAGDLQRPNSHLPYQGAARQLAAVRQLRAAPLPSLVSLFRHGTWGRACGWRPPVRRGRSGRTPLLSRNPNPRVCVCVCVCVCQRICLFYSNPYSTHEHYTHEGKGSGPTRQRTAINHPRRKLGHGRCQRYVLHTPPCHQKQLLSYWDGRHEEGRGSPGGYP